MASYFAQYVSCCTLARTWSRISHCRQIFALSIELFGHAMTEMEEGKIGKAEVFVSMLAALCGALSFIAMNRVVGGHGDHEGEDHGNNSVTFCMMKNLHL